ncbi:MAG: hypothetical protein ABL308_11840 [Oceanicaulis sp.]
MTAETPTTAPNRDSLWRYVLAFAGGAVVASILTPALYGFVDGFTRTVTSQITPAAFIMAAFTGAVSGAAWVAAFRLAGDLKAQLAVPWLGTLALVVWVVALLSAFEHAMAYGAWPSDPSRELIEVTLYAAAFFIVFKQGAARFGRW